MSPIPRLISRGLIEAGGVPSERDVFVRIPRLISRGLIEAGATTERVEFADLDIPRLISRGLIEAAAKYDDAARTFAHSAADQPRPH